MIADVRRAVAVASYVMVTNRVASSVFDFANGGYHPMSVSHTGNFLSVYDYQRSNYLSGWKACAGRDGVGEGEAWR